MVSKYDKMFMVKIWKSSIYILLFFYFWTFNSYAEPQGKAGRHPIYKCKMLFERLFGAYSTSPTKYKPARMSPSAWLIDLITFEKYRSIDEVQKHEIFFDKTSSQWVYHGDKGAILPVRPGNYNLVMNPDGHIYIFPRRGMVHSAALWGGDVGAAGLIHFKGEGEMGLWAPETGHYYTGFENDSVNSNQLLQEVADRGANAHSIQVVPYYQFPNDRGP